MPDVGPFGYLIEALFEIGPVKSGFAGPVAIDWQDVHAWNELTRYGVHPWEARAIVRLSRAYCNALSDARDPAAPPPYVGDVIVAAEEHGAAVGAAFRALARIMPAKE